MGLQGLNIFINMTKNICCYAATGHTLEPHFDLYCSYNMMAALKNENQ